MSHAQAIKKSHLITLFKIQVIWIEAQILNFHILNTVTKTYVNFQCTRQVHNFLTQCSHLRSTMSILSEYSMIPSLSLSPSSLFTNISLHSVEILFNYNTNKSNK
jgi:hypothetical protein